MFLLENSIVDLPMSPGIQAEIIECFKGIDDLIIFGYIEYNEEDLEYLRKLLGFSEKDEIEFAASILKESKEPVFITQEEYMREWGKSINTIKWYRVDSKEELVRTIEEMGITYECYIVNKKSSIKNYTHKLHAYEHHVIDEKEDFEHRSLFFEGKDINFFKTNILPKIEKVFEKYKVDR